MPRNMHEQAGERRLTAAWRRSRLSGARDLESLAVGGQCRQRAQSIDGTNQLKLLRRFFTVIRPFKLQFVVKLTFLNSPANRPSSLMP